MSIRTGTLACTFSEHGQEWMTDAQAWGRTSSSIATVWPAERASRYDPMLRKIDRCRWWKNHHNW